ncbi:MAG: DUF2860 domain-containing protein [Desulfobacterales bacterium]|nr:DUF2860 domain-containing protein [Desulfobacterales bacterium]
MIQLNSKIIAGLVWCLVFINLTGTALAESCAEDQGQQNDSFSPGFSGSIQPMIGIIHSKSLSEVSDENRKIDSLDEDADSETEFAAMFLWDIGYTLENRSTRFFAGTPEQNIIEGSFMLEAGIQQKLMNGTILSISYIPEIAGLADEVWEDPYLTGADRDETDRESQAVRVGAESIFGSPLTLRYGFGTQDIDNDNAGLDNYQRGTITYEEFRSLKRSGDFHQIEALYAIPLNNHIMIQPCLTYTKGDMDGDAYSFDRFSGQITFKTHLGKWNCFSTLSIEHTEYDATNPIFEKTREEWAYNAIIGAGYMAPFGWNNFMFNIYSGFTKDDANIGYYDSTAIICGIGLTWLF